MQYRREIDGLRSVAVVPVLFFHAGAEMLAGGYLGVDVFFVISGYLITGIILPDLMAKRFSILNFYERRARRILPALIVMSLACVPLAWMFMLPDPLENFGQSLIATMLSVNNVALTLTSGYWDLSSEFKPLLHTWSLGVEEQFYFIFPAFLMLVFAFFRQMALAAVLIVIFVSFLAAVLLVDRYPSSTFYLLHTRAWELGLGALGAVLEQRKKTEANNPLATAGLAMIVVPMFLWDHETLHPSYTTLIPVLGTLMVLLFAKQGTLVAKLLSLRPAVGLGLISYSLYLWHQPVFAFARITSFEEPNSGKFWLLGIVTVGLAFFSWKFVEQPFRSKNTVSTRSLVWLCTSTTILLIAVGALLWSQKGFPGRFFDKSSEGFAGQNIEYNSRIHAYNVDRFTDDDRRKVLIVGNSLARDFANVLFEAGTLDDAELIYRPIGFPVCDPSARSDPQSALFNAADAVFFVVKRVPRNCGTVLASKAPVDEKVIFVGPKHFGYNLNAFMRLPKENRPEYTGRIFDKIVHFNKRNKGEVPAHRYIDMLSLASDDGEYIRIFDDAGNIMSMDRVHITRAGARFYAQRIKDHPALQF